MELLLLFIYNTYKDTTIVNFPESYFYKFTQFSVNFPYLLKKLFGKTKTDFCKVLTIYSESVKKKLCRVGNYNQTTLGWYTERQYLLIYFKFKN